MITAKDYVEARDMLLEVAEYHDPTAYEVHVMDQVNADTREMNNRALETTSSEGTISEIKAAVLTWTWDATLAEAGRGCPHVHDPDFIGKAWMVPSVGRYECEQCWTPPEILRIEDAQMQTMPCDICGSHENKDRFAWIEAGIVVGVVLCGRCHQWLQDGEDQTPPEWIN